MTLSPAQLERNWKASSRALKINKETANLRALLLLTAREDLQAPPRDIMRVFGIEHEAAFYNALSRARKRREAIEAEKTEAARKHLAATAAREK